ncbi:SAM-dependent methyltransferase [Kitasatospora gansuensis]|uniref:SAM-dependent methyltransferase n=1 Tax=Kitasatospora gansuensis TaxID=258050 RepID=A0A7W7WIF7_9ACTN|nr:class I SAM-dependent methyltransferase [Kitasatospora gansuensis]MBB4947790.1 SAM-dependent methyltransferase [Kitasatospora gansuensis]
MGERSASTAGYREEAPLLVTQYESVTFDQVHREILHLMPQQPMDVLELGAGTGRDAAALAARGHRVTAVEPIVELRVHEGPGIDWVVDELPALARVTGRFGLVLATAVWMHLDPAERRTATGRVAELLAPGGRFVLHLRHGPVPQGRRMFEVTAAETAELGAEFGLTEVYRGERADKHGRSGVSWSQLVLDRAPATVRG